MYALFKSNPTWTQFNMSFKFRCRALIFGLAVLSLSAGCNEQCAHTTCALHGALLYILKMYLYYAVGAGTVE